jgi:hypothetical protein
MPQDINLDATRHSVQDVVTDKDRVFGTFARFLPPMPDSAYLAGWGNPRREWQLRQYYRAMYNTLFSSVASNLATEIAATPWQLYGKRNRDYYHKVLTQAQFGMGWRAFIQVVVQDYLVFDMGACIEVIGKGNALKPITGRVEGIATLDPIYTELTGNLQYPVIYRSAQGGYHRMESTRVRRIVMSPQSDRDYYGRGFSALSKYFWHCYRQILMGRYSIEKLSDLPQGGAILTNNISNFDVAQRQYEADRQRDGQGVYRSPIVLDAYDPGQPMDLKFISFRELPEHFDYEAYEKSDEKRCALSIGIDFQDVAPLSGQGLGTGAQSIILAKKSKAKTPGLLLAEIETLINFDVLPAYLEFEFTLSDAEGEKQEAETAQSWVNVANTTPGLGTEQRLRLTVNKVQAIRDVATDKEGNLDYEDTDKPPPQGATEDDDITPAEDNAPEGTETDDETPLDDTEQQRAFHQKDYQSTRLDYEGDVANLVNAAVAGDVQRVRFGVAMRSLLDKYGRKAMRDGLAAGGVDVDVLEGDDLDTFKAWQREQSLYVSSMGDAIYKEGIQYTGDARAHAWANKSLNGIYNKGLLSADRNGVYTWILGRTKDHCKTCSKNANQSHRLIWWHKNACLPKGDCLECGGYECDCGLVRRRGRTRES